MDRPGLWRLVIGFLLLGGGVAVTMMSENTVWYGAILVGVYYVGTGAYRLMRSSPPPPPPEP